MKVGTWAAGLVAAMTMVACGPLVAALATGAALSGAPSDSVPTGADANGLGCEVPAGTGLAVPGPGGPTYTLDAEQLSNATVIVRTGQSLSLPTPALVISIMTALVESSIENLPNAAVPGSLTNPNVQWGSYTPADMPHDGTSVGFFQQQANWGTVDQRMDPVTETRSFFGAPSAGPPGLLQIPGWPALPPGDAAQAVQASAFPDRYAAWQPAAAAIVAAVLRIPCAGSPVTASAPDAAAAVAVAQSQIGRPYVWGGGGGAPINGPSGVAVAPAGQVGQPGFDCSGLTQYVYGTIGLVIPRTSQAQYGMVQAAGSLVATISQLQIGDLVFFGGGGYEGGPGNAGHVGIYIGTGQMIDAPFTGVDVRVDPVTTDGFLGGGPA